MADALASPTHWYYKIDKLVEDWGTITGYNKPREHFAGYMKLTPGTSTIIGEVILHGKYPLWEQGDIHYHFGLESGENTLEASLARLLMRTMGQEGEFTFD